MHHADLQASPPPSFTEEELARAHREWGCNCGPASIAALLGIAPDEVLPHLATFRQKGHMNQPDVRVALRSLDLDSVARPFYGRMPACGLVRVQWGGPWLLPGVPRGAALIRTHWIAALAWEGRRWLYDVNAGWQAPEEWEAETAPRILATVPRNDGTWKYLDVVEREGRPWR